MMGSGRICIHHLLLSIATKRRIFSYFLTDLWIRSPKYAFSVNGLRRQEIIEWE
jgi:hypothetical protein